MKNQQTIPSEFHDALRAQSRRRNEIQRRDYMFTNRIKCDDEGSRLLAVIASKRMEAAFAKDTERARLHREASVAEAEAGAHRLTEQAAAAEARDAIKQLGQLPGGNRTLRRALERLCGRANPTARARRRVERLLGRAVV